MNEDKLTRIRALDIHHSFIVQAPAGSGKTEILTQRFLKLLAFSVKAPEEILAVTFTKKAAAEMSHRIISALQKAKVACPEAPHEKVTWELGVAALKKNTLLDWRLEENPNRLRIVTIDALCATLVKRMPVLSQIGCDFTIVELTEEIYQKAAESLLVHTSLEDRGGKALKVLFTHLDNRIEKITHFLVDLLGKRDQWLPYLGEIKNLESALNRLVSAHLARLKACFSETQEARLIPLIRYAAKACADDSFHPIAHCIELTRLPGGASTDLFLWQSIAAWLTTKEGSFRKAWNKKVGFPSYREGKENKNALLAFIAEHEQHYPELLPLLIETKYLPASLSASQALIIEALTELLPLLVAHLRVLFQESGKVDFIEVTLKALEALGDPLCISDLALHLDYQVRHILIDEYQDTSVTQYRLFEKLLNGWEEGDGRTLFLVGDPMQSIYRFRGAEVGLFLHTQQQGLGGIFVEPLTLKVNFRSSQTIVQWVNDFFIQWFPKEASKAHGAIAYSPAVSCQLTPGSVHIHPLQSGKDNTAEQVIFLIKEALIAHPDARIAVLTRAKKSLYPIVSQLKQSKIAFVAHEVALLSEQIHVIDLLSLLRAITDKADRIAWFSILRAPWLGLSLADLLVLSREKDRLIWEVIKEGKSPISEEGKKRLKRVVPIIEYWLLHRGRLPLSQFLRGLWIALGGPACYTGAHFLEEIDIIFQLLDQYDNSETVMRVLSQRYSDIVGGKSQNPQVTLMTLHKAKGLEFDVVIMPDLQTKTKKTPSLLLWLEHPYEKGIDLILAPYRDHKADEDHLYQYVARQIDQKEAYEAVRLFYVGATRAKRRLHLLGESAVNEQGEWIAPSQGSFWAMLWPEVADSFKPALLASHIGNRISSSHDLKRLPSEWRAPFLIGKKLTTLLQPSPPVDLNFPPEDDPLWREAGVVFHRVLQYLVQGEKIFPLEKSALLALKRKGLSGERLNKAFKWVKKGVHNIMNDPRGQWILDPSHQDRQSEWTLSASLFGKIENIVIDCAFIDQNGIRWIVDYKLTFETDPSLYQFQLDKYYYALKTLEQRPIRCGLYFPLVKKWWERGEDER